MIFADDLTASQVRRQYVLPLLQEILEKSCLTGIITDTSSSSTSISSLSLSGTRTLFQEIVTNDRDYIKEKTGGNKEGSMEACNVRCSIGRCYSEMIEEACALSTYMEPQEISLITAIVSSCFLAFLLPQCHSIGFLHSYFKPLRNCNSPNLSSMPSVVYSIEERLEVIMTSASDNDLLSIVYPHSSPRVRSLIEQNNGFISSSFYRFMEQGLGSFLSCGRVFISSQHGGTGRIRKSDASFWAGVDLIQLLAMSICPSLPRFQEVRRSHRSLSPETFHDVKDRETLHSTLHSQNCSNPLAQSIFPYSFQLSYDDRVQLVSLCAEKLVVPEDIGEPLHIELTSSLDGDILYSGVVSNERKRPRRGSEEQVYSDAIQQLRMSLFGFSRYVAQSDRDATIALKALANIAVHEGNSITAQYEFKRLLTSLLESLTPDVVNILGECLSDMICRHNGSRFYADRAFTEFALELIRSYLHESIVLSTGELESMTFKDVCTNGPLDEVTNSPHEKDSNKRRRRVIYKTFHLVALLKVAKCLFFFLLDAAKMKGEGEYNSVLKNSSYDSEFTRLLKNQVLNDTTLLLYAFSDLKDIRSTAEMLAVALVYEKDYASNITNLKHLFAHTRKAIDKWCAFVDTQEDNSILTSKDDDIIDALKPFIIIIAQESKTFAFNLLSYSFRVRAEKSQTSSVFNRRIFWHLVATVSSVQPHLLSSKLDELYESFIGLCHLHELSSIYLIRTYLSCGRIFNSNQVSTNALQKCLSIAKFVKHHWIFYQIVRYSFVTTNFAFAHHILANKLAEKCSQQQSFMWLHSLSRLAAAEDILKLSGCLGIPDAIEKMSSCYSSVLFLVSLRKRTCHQKDFFGSIEEFVFQEQYLRARLDFLHLCTATRFICSELIITCGNSNYTHCRSRSELFIKNLPKCFMMLSSRYMKMYQLFGLHYCAQTRSALRSLCSACRLLSQAMTEVFSRADSNPRSSNSQKNKEHENEKTPFTDKRRNPLELLLSQLLMCPRTNFDNEINSASPSTSDILAVLDVVLRCPLPFPMGFFKIKTIPFAHINISTYSGHSALTSETKVKSEKICMSTFEKEEVLHVARGSPFKLVISGVVPYNFTKIPFYQVIAWLTFSHDGRLIDDDDDDADDLSGNQDDELVDLKETNATDPISTTMLPDGKFILLIDCEPIIQSGYHIVNVNLGCRDICCGEWQVPTKNQIAMRLCVR